MKRKRVVYLAVVMAVLAITPPLSHQARGATSGPLLAERAAVNAPAAGPCMAGALYDPACDVDHDGDLDVFDIQLTAGHWGQAGVWTSDNAHDHLGQTWTGSDNPLTVQGAFTGAGSAALILSPSAGDGLRIDVPQDDGVYVVSAGDRGLFISSAGFEGVLISEAGSDGVHVSRAGSVQSWVSSTPKNGFEIGGAEGHGLFVGRVELDGVEVYQAGGNGLLVVQAELNGVDATSSSAAHYGGRFVNGAAGGAGVYASGGSNTAADLILGGTASADDGRIYSQPSVADSDVLLFSNDEAHVHLDEDNNSDSSFVIYNGTNSSVWSVTEAGVAVTSGASAALVDAGAQDQRLAYAVVSPQNWIEDFGSGQLLDGQAAVALELRFAESISPAQPYHVFLTPLGDCPLYVAGKDTAGFTVRAMDARQCSIAFDYRIVGLRRGYETLRLEPFALSGD